MKKCFLCGKEYDEKNKKSLIEVSYGLDALTPIPHFEPVKQVSDNTEKVLQACPSCVRAGLFFIILKMKLAGNTCYTNIEPVYEDDENVANQTTPVVADVKSDEK